MCRLVRYSSDKLLKLCVLSAEHNEVVFRHAGDGLVAVVETEALQDQGAQYAQPRDEQNVL